LSFIVLTDVLQPLPSDVNPFSKTKEDAMKYAEALQLINPYKVLYALNLKPQAQGGYLSFSCPACQEPAVIKTHSEKKNVWYCPKCKDSGNVISLVMRLKKLEYPEAKTFCLERVAIGVKSSLLTKLSTAAPFGYAAPGER
jgi:ribosomal protein L37AE/L43A